MNCTSCARIVNSRAANCVGRIESQPIESLHEGQPGDATIRHESTSPSRGRRTIEPRGQHARPRGRFRQDLDDDVITVARERALPAGCGRARCTTGAGRSYEKRSSVACSASSPVMSGVESKEGKSSRSFC